MRKMIDTVSDRLTEIGYTNKNGVVEVVDITNPALLSMRSVRSAGDTTILHSIYYEDVPKFILAMQDAYDEITKQKRNDNA